MHPPVSLPLSLPCLTCRALPPSLTLLPSPPDPSFALPQMTNVTVKQTAIRAIQHNVSLDQHGDKSKYHSINTALQASCPCARVEVRTPLLRQLAWVTGSQSRFQPHQPSY